MGGNVTPGERIPQNAAVPRQPLGKSSKSSSDGVLKDLNSMEDFMIERKISVYSKMLGSRHLKQDKSVILGAFKNFLTQKDVKRFVIYYSGHGSDGKFNTNKGDWCFETTDGSESKIIYIGLKDILELWDEIKSHYGSDSYEFANRDLLFIIADSCFSGGWVDEIMAKRLPKTAPSGENYRDVHMIASCQFNEVCYYTATHGGDFTHRYITADSSKHNLKPTATHVAKLASQSVVQGVTFPLYMPVKGLFNLYNSSSHKHTPVATNDKSDYKVLLMQYVGEILPIGRGLGIAAGWSWMLSGQIFHN